MFKKEALQGTGNVDTADAGRSESKQSGGRELPAWYHVHVRASSAITQDIRKTCIKTILCPGPKKWKELPQGIFKP